MSKNCFCVGAFVVVDESSSRSKERRTFIASDALLFDMYTKNRKERRRRSPINKAKMVDDDDNDLSRQPNVLPLSSSMLPPPLIDRFCGFFGTTFDDQWVPRCRDTVRNASRAAALNIIVEREGLFCPSFLPFDESGKNLTQNSSFFFFWSKNNEKGF